MYRRSIPQINLSIERNTDKVPCDGKYYLFKDGVIIKVCRSKAKADELFKKIVDESGYKPPKIDISNYSNEALDRFLRDRIIFHAEGAKYNSRGGRGR